MKSKTSFSLFIAILLLGCGKEIDFNRNLSDSEGLSLYWDHQIFGEQGRGFIFEFYEAQRLENQYELVFDIKVDNRRKNIDIYLRDKIDEGKCPYFPTPDQTDNLCISSGDFFIPEDQLKEGEYTFLVKTADFTIQSTFSVSKDQVKLSIPENDYFSCSIENVYPTPKNLLYGNVIFNGEENTQYAEAFFAKLKSFGLNDTIVSNSPFNLPVDDSGKPEDRHWDTDKHSLAFLYSLNSGFQSVVDISKQFFDNYDLNIYLFTTNGDQASLSKAHGITVFYAK
ncbi:hypothetical protein [Maribellus maritimus]|uniref:hypothetical protein n=1 Tax=Maribellus maritimus TaxID=2870838 RepID=UPI001EEA7A6C|nr:hypothetical protein [Maribellus maritimus]MCG6186220.1 hypothetical protein [Maribellus maritimus]